MSIKRFFGKTTREALNMVRDALGPDGVILSNRATDGGVEILALGPDDITAMMPSSAEHEAGNMPQRRQDDFTEESVSQEQIVDSPYGKNLPELNVQANTGTRHIKSAKDLPRLHFPSFDGRQEQSAKRWEIPELTTEPRQGRESLVTPDSVGQSTNRRPAFRSRPQTDSGKDDWRADQTLNSMTEKIANREPISWPESQQVDSVEDPLVSEPASGKKRVAASTRKTAKQASGTTISTKSPQPGFDPRQIADEVAANVLREIKSMRGTLEQQLSALTWNDRERRDPMRAQILRRILAAGFSVSLAHDLLERMPAGQDEETAMGWVKTVLTSNLQTIGNENEMLEKGGVYALVGPTGVGKTTTTAKLAARCVVRHGSDKLALLTTDGYRIGGHEQLRIYGKILGVTVYAVKDTQDLALALAELRGKHMVLIDTVGMGQRDKMVAEQAAMLAGCGTEVKRLLLLNATSSGDTLEEVARAYQGGGLAGAIITKLDEAVTTGCALDTAIRHQLPLYFMATGQRVPEDLHLAEARPLIDAALSNLPAASPFAMPEDAFPLLAGNFRSGAANLDMNGAYFG